jgi:hypothetical protein
MSYEPGCGYICYYKTTFFIVLLWSYLYPKWSLGIDGTFNLILELLKEWLFFVLVLLLDILLSLKLDILEV